MVVSYNWSKVKSLSLGTVIRMTLPAIVLLILSNSPVHCRIQSYRNHGERSMRHNIAHGISGLAATALDKHPEKDPEFLTLQKQSAPYEKDENLRPPYTYVRLILQALLSRPDNRMTYNEILSFVANKYPYYGRETPMEWKTILRLELIQTRYKSCFIHLAPDGNTCLTNGKGRPPGYWTIREDLKGKLFKDAYIKGRSKIKTLETVKW